MKPKGLKVTKNNVEQKIDLKKHFGISFNGKPKLRELVGQAILDRIVDRTKKGRGVGGSKKLKSPYSSPYANSLDFKAHGKSKNKINMTLTGDMLGLMNIKKSTSDSLTIGWDRGDKQDPKVFNHVTGDTVPKRNFFGVTSKELSKIKSELAGDLKASISEDKQKTDDIFGLIKEVIKT